MWLINTSTQSLEFFYGDSTPSYAILSHTWGQDELTFTEFRHPDPDTKDILARKSGYRKVIDTCDQAKNDGLDYVWIDTCCIDKTSSAELTEAINSMYTWYRHSQICYAYLSDVEIDNVEDEPVSTYREHVDAAFRQCRWFTRGWCLQELLAPPCLRFYNKNWQVIGDKSLLSGIIARITGIPQVLLVSNSTIDVYDFPIATRISWISRRQTTRLEDMSYSLLGILDINMPMLYGEGRKAFQRLQEEVIRKYNDLSIFAWTEPATSISTGFIPVLAPAPSSFIRDFVPTDAQIENVDTHLGSRVNTQFSLTNQGVVFPSVKLYSQHPRVPFRHQYVLYLNHRDSSFRGIVDFKWYIVLQKVGPGLFVRLHESTHRLTAFRRRPVIDPCSEPICILNQLTAPLLRQLTMWERYAVRLRWKSWAHQRQKFFHIRAVEPHANWDRVAGQFLVEMATEQYMHIEFAPGEYRTNPDMEYFVLVIQVGDGKKRNAKQVSAHIVSGQIWPGVNATPFRFAFRENLALRALEKTPGGGDSTRISLVGYDISMSVEVVQGDDGVPYHSIYLDWVKSRPKGGDGTAEVGTC